MTSMSPIWQAASAVKLLSLLSFTLFVPAVWGIAKHVHALFVSPIERLGVPSYVVTQAAVVVVCGVWALESAGNAVKDLRTAAVQKAELPSYFGVEPEWMCVEPTVPAAKLSSRGGILSPERPYVSFGEAGDTVSLWDEPAGKASPDAGRTGTPRPGGGWPRHRVDSEVGGHLLDRHARAAVPRDPHDILAELFRMHGLVANST
ncbi:hypothetical protein ACFVXE_02085 [Streptomyces sp. NPDC058231]|uniref:hypothetical protein n=1 Tax=Streptomyces sp. NPDC058231 TaxID=3346392 RepID=UPI0036EE3EE2